MTPEPDDEDDDSTDTHSAAEAQDVADIIIPRLAVAKEPVEVAHQCANEKYLEKMDDISAYAKVCGRTWTYYIQEPVVKIGRAPELGRQDSANGLTSSPIVKKTSPMNIDLGPSKMVSRSHAEFSFDGENDRWVIHVHSRNGVKWNDVMLKSGHRKPVNSGDILEIAGTQMMFITANEPAKINSVFMHLLNGADLSDEDVKATNGYHAPQIMTNSYIPSSQIRPLNSDAILDQKSMAPPSSDFLRPNTPLRPKKLAPSSAATQPYSSFPSSSVGKGMSITSSEPIDYNHPSYKDLKPPFSYACMIARAIFSTEEQAITLSDLYAWIRGNFSYFRNFDPNWDPALGDAKLPSDLLKRVNTMQNSVRHNLSVHDLFTKVPRRSDEPGKGMKWRVAEEKMDEALKLVEKQTSKSGGSKRRSRSNPSSPVAQGHRENTAMIRTSPTSRLTPPRSVPLNAGSQTPTHRPSQHGHPPLPRFVANEPSLPHPHFSSDASPAQRSSHANGRRRDVFQSSLAPGSSPTLTSGAWGTYNGADNASSFFTPAPQKYNLNNNLQPGTAKLPTSHMADSSPAPFWKFLGQTPGDLGTGGLPPTFGSSPIKSGGDRNAAVEAKRPSLSSSSSPVEPASPSTNRSGPSSNFAKRVENATAPSKTHHVGNFIQVGGGAGEETILADDEDDEADLEGGVDLAR